MLKVGCCGFPCSRPKYVQRFPVVEVQQTFYQPPRVCTLEKWRAQAAQPFQFFLKAWQLITHTASSPTYRRLTTPLSSRELRDCGAFQNSDLVRRAWETTHTCAEALSACGILFQCPPSFPPDTLNLANFRRFFQKLDRHGFRLLWEPRGPWPDDLVAGLCRDLDLVHVVDPFLRPTVTPGFIYYRLHGGKDYRHRFSVAELRQVHLSIPAGVPAYVMFNNNGMLEDASCFQAMLTAGAHHLSGESPCGQLLLGIASEK